MCIEPSEIDVFASSVRAGGLAIFPTSTSYGFGCDATNAETVQKVFAIKGRDPEKPFLIVVSSVAVTREYLVWN